MKQLLRYLLWTLIPLLGMPIAQAQLVGGESFMQGLYTEVGVSSCGSFGTNAAPPVGYHPNSTLPGLGFVCDADMDGWTTGSPNYCGDYFVPGTPEEGFTVRANGANYTNSGTPGICGNNDIAGAMSSYTLTGTDVTSVWLGNIAGLSITQTTSFPLNARYFLTSVQICNTTAATITGVYYMRNVDPDNEQPSSGSFTTTQGVPFQQPTSADCKALVTATGQLYGCFLGLGTKDVRARVAYGGFTNTDPVAAWNGTGGLSQSGTSSADEGICISFNIGDIPPGGCETVAFVYILDQADLDVALNATTNPTYLADGIDVTSSQGLSFCESSVGTLLEIVNGGGYSWNWSPATGLSSTTGTTVYANPAATTTYTITGTSPCAPTVSKVITVNVLPPPAPPSAPDQTINCGSTTTITATPSLGGDIEWYLSNAPGSPLLYTGLTYTTPTISSNTTYYIQEVTDVPGSGNNVLPFVENFEALSGTFTANATVGAWTYNKTTEGRLRISNTPSAPFTGTKCAILDDATNNATKSTNELIVELDLSGYNLATDLKLEFVFKDHASEPDAANGVFIRGSNTDPWLLIYDWYANKDVAGVWKEVKNLDIDALLSANGQTATATFQLKFVQRDDERTTGETTRDGLSLDDIVITGSDNVAPSFCRSARVPVNINVTTLPSPSVVGGSVACPGGIVNLSAASTSGVAGNVLNWYDAAVGGTLVNTGTTYAPNITGTTTFYVQEQKPGVNISWTFDSNLDGWTASLGCSSTATWAWNSDGGTGALKAASSGSSSQKVLSPAIGVSGLTVVDLTYRHRIDSESGYDHGYVAFRLDGGAWQQFYPTTGSYTINDGEYNEPLFSACGTPTMDLYSGNFAYRIDGGSINVTGATTLEVIFVFTSDGSVNYDNWYIDEVSVSSGSSPCGSARVPVVAAIDPLPDPTTANVNLCAGGSVTLNASINSGLTGTVLEWYDAASGGTLLQTGASYTTPVLGSTTTYYVQESTVAGPSSYSWTFDSNLDGWASAANCTYAYQWAWNSDAGAGTAYASDPSSNSSQTLISPVIDITGATAITLDFRHKYGTESCCDHGYVAYRLDGGAWQKFTPTTNGYTGSDGQYNDPILGTCTTVTTDLFYGTSAYKVSSGPIVPAGASSLQIAFLMTSDGSVSSTGWFIDYVNVTTDASGSICTSNRIPVTVNVGAPVNDEICGATDAFVGDNLLPTNVCADTEVNEPTPGCFNSNSGSSDRINKTIWAKFTPGTTGTYRCYIKSGTEASPALVGVTGGQFDSEMALYTISAGTPCTNQFNSGLTLAQLICDDDSGVGLYSEFNYYMTAGTTYYFQVDGAAYDNAGGGIKGARTAAYLDASESNDIVLTIEFVSPLPVEFVKFTATKNGEQNIVTWTTGTERSAKNFEIQRSADGENFSTIGVLESKGSNSTYRFADVRPLSKSYYRLKQVDQDGAVAYTRVVYLNRDEVKFGIIEMKPNPTSSFVDVSFELDKSTSIQIQVVDMLGKVLYNTIMDGTQGVNEARLDLTPYAKGVYMIHIIREDRRILEKIVRE